MAALCKICKNAMLSNTGMLAHGKRRGIDKANYCAISHASAQVDRQGVENHRHECDKSLIADQGRNLPAQVQTDVLCGEGFADAWKRMTSVSSSLGAMRVVVAVGGCRHSAIAAPTADKNHRHHQTIRVTSYASSSGRPVGIAK